MYIIRPPLSVLKISRYPNKFDLQMLSLSPDLTDPACFDLAIGYIHMELDLQSIFWLHVHSCTHLLKPPNPPSLPQHLGSYTRTLLVTGHSTGQPR